MEKSKINRFVQKYTLAGLVESVKWETKDNTLSTSFISDDKSVLGSVSISYFDFQNTTLGIYDTSKLTKMIAVLDDDLEFNVSDVESATTFVESFRLIVEKAFPPLLTLAKLKLPEPSVCNT